MPLSKALGERHVARHVPKSGLKRVICQDEATLCGCTVHRYLSERKQEPFFNLDKLGRLQDSNAVLSHFNEYSENCFAEVSSDFSRNTRILKSMKSDLDYIFQKLRSMKAKIMAIYPDAFPDESTSELFDQRPDLEAPQ